MNQSVNQSISRSINRSVNRSINQAINLYIHTKQSPSQVATGKLKNWKTENWGQKSLGRKKLGGGNQHMLSLQPCKCSTLNNRRPAVWQDALTGKSSCRATCRGIAAVSCTAAPGSLCLCQLAAPASAQCSPLARTSEAVSSLKQPPRAHGLSGDELCRRRHIMHPCGESAPRAIYASLGACASCLACSDCAK